MRSLFASRKLFSFLGPSCYLTRNELIITGVFIVGLKQGLHYLIVKDFGSQCYFFGSDGVQRATLPEN